MTLGSEPTLEQMIYDLRYGTTNQEVKSSLKRLEIDNLYHRFRIHKVFNPTDSKRVRDLYKEYMR